MHSTEQTGMAKYAGEAVALLEELIAIPSPSREESGTASRLAEFLTGHGCAVERSGNNVWTRAAPPQPARPTVLLVSHHDTVKPVAGWKRDPFTPAVEDGALYGLGSNDAGGALCAMLAAFLYLKAAEHLPVNLIFAASAEEEIAGTGGIESILPALGPVDMAVVGEPTGMKAAVAERGLMVLDCTARGIAGHAARRTGINAIDIACDDIMWFRSFAFPKVSRLLGHVSMTVTQISAGIQHNVVPDVCTFVVDIRVTDCYTHEEILETVRAHIRSVASPRSMRLRPSIVPDTHPLARAARAAGMECFASPTMSDQALLPMPSIKVGPGLSERSHTADEHIHVGEIHDGVRGYVTLLDRLAEDIAE